MGWGRVPHRWPGSGASRGASEDAVPPGKLAKHHLHRPSLGRSLLSSVAIVTSTGTDLLPASCRAPTLPSLALGTSTPGQAASHSSSHLAHSWAQLECNKGLLGGRMSKWVVLQW